jgi:hypothetical protein
MFRLLWCFTNASFSPCNILRLRHLFPITFYNYDILTPMFTSRYLSSTPLLGWTSCHCIRKFTFFYLACDRASTLAGRQNVDIFSQVTRADLKVFWLAGGWQNDTTVKFRVLLSHFFLRHIKSAHHYSWSEKENFIRLSQNSIRSFLIKFEEPFARVNFLSCTVKMFFK